MFCTAVHIKSFSNMHKQVRWHGAHLVRAARLSYYYTTADQCKQAIECAKRRETRRDERSRAGCNRVIIKSSGNCLSDRQGNCLETGLPPSKALRCLSSRNSVAENITIVQPVWNFPPRQRKNAVSGASQTACRHLSDPAIWASRAGSTVPLTAAAGANGAC